jgi:hypothetical protein
MPKKYVSQEVSQEVSNDKFCDKGTLYMKNILFFVYLKQKTIIGKFHSKSIYGILIIAL